MSLVFMIYHLMLSENSYGLVIWQGIFGGVNFGPGICFGFDFGFNRLQ